MWPQVVFSYNPPPSPDAASVGWVPQDWFVDGVNHLLAASGQLMVRDTFWAGPMQHFSMRSGKISATALKIKFLGILLLEGHLAEHCVQADVFSV